MADLEEPDDEHDEADGLHDVGVVLQQRVSAALLVQVQFLRLIVVVVVSRAVGDVVLDARPRGVQVTAAEGHAVQEVLPVHVASLPANRKRKQKVVFCFSWTELGTAHLCRISDLRLTHIRLVKLSRNQRDIKT